MKELKDLKPGDEVRYFSANERTIPRGGRPMWVHKVGRKLIKVVCQKEDVGKDDTWGVDEFRIETGSANDGYGHSHISTVEAAEDDEEMGWKELEKLEVNELPT